MTDILDRPQVSLKPPAPTAKLVLQHRKRLEAERDALQNGVAELALKSAHGDTAARAELRAVASKREGLQFEIDQNHTANELAVKQDSDAEVFWRLELPRLPPEELISGINRDECCSACRPGVTGGCVLAGGAAYADSGCIHPIRFGSHHQFVIGDDGKRIFPHRDHPRAAKVFRAAIEKLKVTGKFAP